MDRKVDLLEETEPTEVRMSEQRMRQFKVSTVNAIRIRNADRGSTLARSAITLVRTEDPPRRSSIISITESLPIDGDGFKATGVDAEETWGGSAAGHFDRDIGL